MAINFQDIFTDSTGVIHFDRLTSKRQLRENKKPRPVNHVALMGKLVTDLGAEEFDRIDIPNQAVYLNPVQAKARLEALDKSAKKGRAASYIVRTQTTSSQLREVGIVSFMYPEVDDDLISTIVSKAMPRHEPIRDFAGWIRKDRLVHVRATEAGQRVMQASVELARAIGITELHVSAAQKVLDEPVGGALISVEAFAGDAKFTNIGPVVQRTEGQEYPGVGFVLDLRSAA